MSINENDEWISFDDRYPDNFPVNGRNYDMKFQDVITGEDPSNQTFKHAFFCKSLPFKDLSLPFTHWKPIEKQK